ncbi:MAG TPA: enoyl-CoA hydratase-related protein [Anaerolineales bacterium]|nr:enoyl-CoA hydratase-related protein [Anaerolineales bacterium]
MTYQYVLTETRQAVGLITLNRPEARNALNNQLVHELMQALQEMDHLEGIHAIVLAGGEKAFAAGADIKEMLALTPDQMRSSGFIQAFARIESLTKPLVAAVSGWALGGGCELALACDLIVASETARFGQPEITIGVIPGAGGTQRLTRRVGKAVAMEVILNNRILSAAEAMHFGLVNRVVPVDRCLDEALALAAEIAARAPVAVRLARRMVLRSFDTPLETGLQEERVQFFEVFASNDRVEGMTAFVEKRDPHWTGS